MQSLAPELVWTCALTRIINPQHKIINSFFKKIENIVNVTGYQLKEEQHLFMICRKKLPPKMNEHGVFTSLLITTRFISTWRIFKTILNISLAQQE